MEYFLVFLFGAVIGSFLNVCIFRIPLGRSVVGPRSYCPCCEHQIRWFDNIPLLSYIWLRGRCRDCGTPISIRYFIVELLSALSGVVLFARFGLSPDLFAYWSLTFALIVVTFVDIEHQEIPDEISLPGIAAGIFLMTVFRLGGADSHTGAFLNSVTGLIAGGGSMFLLGYIGELIFKKEALGGGDVKLMAMLGTFLGWKLVLLTFFMAPVLGSGVGLLMKLRFKKDIIPYGPYLALGAFISVIYGKEILGYIFFTY